MGSLFSSCCGTPDEERTPIVDAEGTAQAAAVRRQVLHDHELKNRRVRFEIEGKYNGGLVKEVYALVENDPVTEVALVTLDNLAQSTYVPVSKIEVLEEIKLGDYCVVMPRREMSLNALAGGFVRYQRLSDPNTNARTFSLHKWETNYNGDIRTDDIKDCHLRRAPPPVTEEASDSAPPISLKGLDNFIGRNKGIQGKRNSCYLDTLLFSLFAFSDTALTDLNGSQSENETNLRILCHSIIYPLRISHFVSNDHVEFLRNHMAKFTNNDNFEDAARDLPECIEALLLKMLSWRPQLSISSIETQDYHFDSTFTLQLMDTTVSVPRAQSLLYAASCIQKFCIEKVPSLFILQLPRETQYHQVTFPDLELDLGPTLFDSPKLCGHCGGPAQFQFLDRFAEHGLEGTFLCRSGAEELGLQVEEARELPEAQNQDAGGPKTRMFLSAVICIERSHYNCFARCGNGQPDDRWVFFDSMSDQEELMDPPTRRDIRFNIPLVEEMPHFTRWLTAAPVRWKSDNESLDGFLNDLDSDEEKDRATRLLKYSYMLFYNRYEEDKP